jgi:hypothetical protein
MKPHKPAKRVPVEMMPAQADQGAAASQPLAANVDLTTVPKSTVAWALLCAQFSAVAVANLVLMTSIAANSIALSRQRRMDS